MDNRTIHIERSQAGKLTLAVELVHSPDDGGFYLAQTDFVKKHGRVCKGIYATEHEAENAYHMGKVKWEPWP